MGATVASLAVGSAGKRIPRTTFILIGALLTSLAILPGDVVTLAPLMVLWLVAGVGQNWVNLPTETLLAERTDESAQGRVYGAHFAWSHLWWAFAYPLAGWLSTAFADRAFLYGGLIALSVLLVVWVSSRRAGSPVSSGAQQNA